MVRRKCKNLRRESIDIDSGHHRRARGRRTFLEAARVVRITSKTDMTRSRRDVNVASVAFGFGKKGVLWRDRETSLERSWSVAIEGASKPSGSSERANVRARARGKKGHGARRVSRGSTEINPPRGKRKRMERIPLSGERRHAFDAWRFGYDARELRSPVAIGVRSTWREAIFNLLVTCVGSGRKIRDAPGTEFSHAQTRNFGSRQSRRNGEEPRVRCDRTRCRHLADARPSIGGGGAALIYAGNVRDVTDAIAWLILNRGGWRR